jgi:hypothetical protein
MSIRENFTLLLQLPDRIECEQDTIDVYAAFEREANEYVRKRSPPLDSRDERFFGKVFFPRSAAGYLEEAACTLARVLGASRNGPEWDKISGRVQDAASALSQCKKEVAKIREVLGLKPIPDDGNFLDYLYNLGDSVSAAIHKSVDLGEALRDLTRRAAEKAGAKP